MDLTLFVGILGAVVGGVIGLFGHRMNLLEQRRRGQRERVADLLRDVDRLNIQADRLRLAAKAMDSDRVTGILPELRETVSMAQHSAQYLDLTAPYLLQQYSRDLWFGADGLYTASLDFWNARLSVPVATLEANYGTAKSELDVRREALIKHLRPKVNSMPW